MFMPMPMGMVIMALPRMSPTLEKQQETKKKSVIITKKGSKIEKVANKFNLTNTTGPSCLAL